MIMYAIDIFFCVSLFVYLFGYTHQRDEEYIILNELAQKTLILNEWLSECLLYNTNWAIFSSIMARTIYIGCIDNDIRFEQNQHA